MKDKVQQAEKLGREMAERLGDNVYSIALFGTAIRGGFAPAHQDINILAIVNDTAPASLALLGDLVNKWAKGGNMPPLIFPLDGWRDATDVFPIEIEDMREAHRIVSGADPFEGVVTRRDDLRRELERETRGKLLQLRAQYVAFAKDGKGLTRLLVESAPAFFVLMRAVVRLAGETPAANPRRLVDRACELAGIDPSAFDWVVRKITGDNVNALQANDSTAVEYLQAIERLAQYVDKA